MREFFLILASSKQTGILIDRRVIFTKTRKNGF